MLDTMDSLRRDVSAQLAPKRKAALGQFMTPSAVARFMASLFSAPTKTHCRLLDAGAGMGALACAFIERWAAGDLKFESLEVDAYEIDDTLRAHLDSTLARYAERLPVTVHVFGGDFIWEAACKRLRGARPYSYAILNPPYKKIHSSSSHRIILRKQGIETVNLYTAFIALSLALMEAHGELVAIVPRSFCNGPYYRPFREFILARGAIRQIHLFDSRIKAFRDDEVLQENVIIRLERDGTQGPVTVSTSTDDTFNDFEAYEHPFERIVFSDDRERFIHVPTSLERNAIEGSRNIRYSLQETGVEVSTGPVVDFRVRYAIVPFAENGTVPLLYPGHFAGQNMQWPLENIKGGNAIHVNADTIRWLYPNGCYTVTRRFSSKEERRRIVAKVVRPESFPEVAFLGFENHLNVFHERKRGLPEDLAHGLAAYLNTTFVDDQFRRFNGHTQVNATDLRSMKYPSRSALAALGRWARQHKDLEQSELDEKVMRLAG